MMALLIWAGKNRSMVLHIASVLVILLLIAGIYFKGRHDATVIANREMALHLAQEQLLAAKAEAAAAKLETRQAKLTTKVVTQYVDRVKVIHEKGATIIQEVPKYVTQADNARCTIPTGFVELWSLSNSGNGPSAVPSTPGTPDAAPAGTPNVQAEEVPSDVQLTDVAQEHALESEYTLSLEEQLRSLQGWVREQQKLSLTP